MEYKYDKVGLCTNFTRWDWTQIITKEKLALEIEMKDQIEYLSAIRSGSQE